MTAAAQGPAEGASAETDRRLIKAAARPIGDRGEQKNPIATA
jgi:hypothetical protein